MPSSSTLTACPVRTFALRALFAAMGSASPAQQERAEVLYGEVLDLCDRLAGLGHHPAGSVLLPEL
jgi:hypothetical protein